MGSTSALKAKAIIANVRKIREAKHYSQEYLAAKLNISQNAYSSIELCRTGVSLSRLIRIAEILEISLPDLVKPGDDEQLSLKVSYKQFKRGGPVAV
jgi:transcriptional regulator with XRE-family HTH domain